MIQLFRKRYTIFKEKARIFEKVFLLFCRFHCFHFISNYDLTFLLFPPNIFLKVYIIFLFLPHSLPIFNFFCRYFFNLLTFQNPFKINGFPIFFTCYFVDMLTLLLYYNRYSTFLLVYVEFRRIMA